MHRNLFFKRERISDGTNYHAYPIVEGVEGQDESVRNAIGAVKEALEQGETVDVIVQAKLQLVYYWRSDMLLM